MAKLLTSRQMQTADRRTIEELGLPGMVLMENAGAGVTQLLQHRVPDWRQQRILILAGRGNNGGDGFVVARRLFQEGGRVSVLLFGDEADLTGDALTNYQVFTRLGGKVRAVTEAADKAADLAPFADLMGHSGVVVDALFGTGLQRPVTGLALSLFHDLNRSPKPVLAVDIPSGVSADSGQVLGAALRADWTVTFAAEKIGHRTWPGAGFCGEVVPVPIGIPAAFIDIPTHKVALNQPDDLVIPKRDPGGHKGRFGHLLILAGSLGKEGAAALAALGALRMGPGLVTVATPRSAQPGVAAKVTEAMTLPLPNNNTESCLGAGSLDTMLESGITPAAMAIGPGLGTNRWAFNAMYGLTARWDVPVVLDADALHVLAKRGRDFVGLTGHRKSPLVLTPHPGEMAQLWECNIQEIQADRLKNARRAAEVWKVWLVLKGAGTVIAAPDGRAWINATGNSGLAAGGSGDLLTGVISGLLSQGWPVESAVRAGVWLHGAAADAAVANGQGEAGLLATDLLPHLRQLRNGLG